MVENAVTLNDPEQRIAVILCYFTKFSGSGADYVKVVELRPKLSMTECSPKILQTLATYDLWGDYRESVKDRHPPPEVHI